MMERGNEESENEEKNNNIRTLSYLNEKLLTSSFGLLLS